MQNTWCPYVVRSSAAIPYFRTFSNCERATENHNLFDEMPHLIPSFEGNYNFLEFISNSKSGQFFFYSHDGKYMIKTQTKEENKFMKRVLPHYYKFVTENPHTMLVRILGDKLTLRHPDLLLSSHLFSCLPYHTTLCHAVLYPVMLCYVISSSLPTAILSMPVSRHAQSEDVSFAA